MVSLVVWDEPCLGETLNQAFISLYAKKVVIITCM